MGAAISSNDRIADNDLLKKFVGLESITDNDPFWNQLLSFNFKPPVQRLDAKYLEESIQDLLASLLYNTTTTGNFAAFVRVFLRRCYELKASVQCHDKIFLWQTCNALIILRYCSKFYAQSLSEAEFLRLFAKNILHSDGTVEVKAQNEPPFETPSEELINALVEILVDLPLSELTQNVHQEAINNLLILLSHQLFREQPFRESVWLKFLMSGGKCTVSASSLTKTCLVNYLLNGCDQQVKGNQHSMSGGGSLVLGLAASFWNVLQWGYTSPDGTVGPTISSQSVLLQLLLVCHNSSQQTPNPYRDALFGFSNSQEKTSLASPTSAASFKLDYSKLYEVICSHAHEESTLLLLYLLLHRNLAFRNYVLSRVNIDPLVLPVLKVLHSDSIAHTMHHLYLALIVILILSEDDFFCKVVHETMVKDVDWFGEQKISEVSLGGLIIMVLVKSIQVNIVKVRDRYLHTNCLAALANMSANFKQLSPVVSQKLVTLLELLSKRHMRAVEHLRKSAEYGLEQSENPQTQANDIAVLEEGIRMLLEIINSSLSHGIHTNPHLVYTLLYKRELFASFAAYPSFQDLVQNIDSVLNHFSMRMKGVDKCASVAEILEVIQKGSLQWSSDRLKKFPELKFRYVEDENTEEFFVPYAWTLVYKLSGLYWDPTKVRLFNAVGIFNS